VTGADGLAADVRALLHEHIESYEQLETLLLLRREPAGHWTGRAVAERLGVPQELIDSGLSGLERSGLLQSDGGASPRFAYRPASPGLEVAVGCLEREYAQRPVLIIQLMSANAIERLRTAALHTFADAFVLKKKDTGRG
jgi:hypothetical protein